MIQVNGKIKFKLKYSYFFFVSIENLSADLLDEYDAEYERIYQIYEKRKPILDAYEKWLTFWNEFVAFTVKKKTLPHDNFFKFCL